MSKKKLLAIILTTSSFPLMAQTTNTDHFYDDRWYLTVGTGYNYQDSNRDTENAISGTIGFGKFINPNWSIDTEINYQNPKANRNEDLNFSQYGISIDARRHFKKPGRLLNPYIVGGIGYQRAEEEYDNFPNPNSPAEIKRNYPTAKLGLGAQADFERLSMRGEIAARHSFDDDSYIAPNKSGFTDVIASVYALFPLGESRQYQAKPAPVIPTTTQDCSLYDDDRDGINNCIDKCDSNVGDMVDNTGCPVSVTIDLRGVNFEFDKARLLPESKHTLDNAIDILKEYPSIEVEVAGHTDSIGSESYNLQLSKERAKVVYDYLVNNGIAKVRLIGPNGYGESRPIAPNTNPDGTDNPEGRAKNRRTELNVK